MKRLYWFLNVLWLSWLAACVGHSVPTTTEADRPLSFELENIPFQIIVPSGWTAVPNEQHFMMMEKPIPIHEDGRLDGIIVNIWLPQNLSGAHADEILAQVVKDPEHGGVKTTPQAFLWNGHDAAYYLVNNHDGNITLVIALLLPNHTLVALNISAPAADSDHLRERLPHLFTSFTIQDWTLGGTGLDMLPPQLQLPTPSQAALQGTAEN